MYNLSWRELWDKPCHETIEEHGKKLEKCNRLVTWQPGTCVPVGKVLKCAGKSKSCHRRRVRRACNRCKAREKRRPLVLFFLLCVFGQEDNSFILIGHNKFLLNQSGSGKISPVSYACGLMCVLFGLVFRRCRLLSQWNHNSRFPTRFKENLFRWKTALVWVNYR